MGKIITFINEKGGIGKTSTCMNLAWHLSDSKKILLVDMDGQRANLTFFLGIEKAPGLITMYNILTQEREAEDGIISVKKNLDIIPADNQVANFSQGTAKITRMKKVMAECREKYDYIFIDVNPTPNWSHVLALSGTDFCVIPMLPDVASLEANRGIAESIEEIKETANPDLKVLGIVFNKNNNRTNLSQAVSEIAEKMAEKLDTKVFKHKIRNTVKLSENVSLHMGITEYAPVSDGAEDIRLLADEIEEEVKRYGK